MVSGETSRYDTVRAAVSAGYPGVTAGHAVYNPQHPDYHVGDAGVESLL